VTGLAIAWHPSPNHTERRGRAKVEMLVLHYTNMTSADAARERLCDPQVEASAHYLVREDGHVWQLVAEHRRAWQAGVAYWRGERDINSHSIGIEIAHPGHIWGYRPFWPAQIASVLQLCQGIIARHGIERRNVVAHSDIAPNRKEDPGELFPWADFAHAGVGLWPTASVPACQAPPLLPSVQRALALYGYEVEGNGSYDLATRNAVLAFQRHFRPERLDGVFDGQCATILADLLRQCGCMPPEGFLR
jgi:N-acetylmuramoyl-L-alanine amidase